MEAKRLNEKVVKIQFNEREVIDKMMVRILINIDQRIRAIERKLGIESKSVLEEVMKYGYNK